MTSALLAFGWQPELKGITVVAIAVLVLIGGSYMIVATNMGARLGLLLTFAAFFGWMTIMAGTWWAYGIGLKGADPTWRPKETLTDLSQARYTNILGDVKLGSDSVVTGAKWHELASDDRGRGQAVAAADEIIQNKAKGLGLKAGDYLPEAVYDQGGNRFPIIELHNVSIFGRKLGDWKIDEFAFLHSQHYSLVQVRPVIKQATEPGKAPPKATMDLTKKPIFVLMQRDRGHRRYPSAFITMFSALSFAVSCIMLHRRDKLVQSNRGAALVPATAGD